MYRNSNSNYSRICSYENGSEMGESHGNLADEGNESENEMRICNEVLGGLLLWMI
jgi:hypothetical protein